MMKVEILGTGCNKCIHLERLLHEVRKESGRKDVEIIRIDDERVIRKYLPLDEIPGLVIDGKLVTSRVIPERGDLEGWLAE
jgi:hypothetical protein